MIARSDKIKELINVNKYHLSLKEDFEDLFNMKMENISKYMVYKKFENIFKDYRSIN